MCTFYLNATHFACVYVLGPDSEANGNYINFHIRSMTGATTQSSNNQMKLFEISPKGNFPKQAIRAAAMM